MGTGTTTTTTTTTITIEWTRATSWPGGPRSRNVASVVRLGLALLVSACASPAPWGLAIEAPPAPNARAIPVTVTAHGFEPNRIEVASGETATLVFTRRVEHTCAKQVIVELDGKHDLTRDLPVDQPVAVTLRFDRPGELGFTCGMKMFGATIVVR